MADLNIIVSIDDPEDIERALLDELRNATRKILYGLEVDIYEFARAKVSEAIQASETWKALISGPLRLEFGLKNPEKSLSSILEVLLNSIKVITVEPTNTQAGGMKVTILGEDYSQLLDAAGASYQSKGGTVEWLSWLLLAGEEIVLSDSRFQFTTFGQDIRASRSKRALMIYRNPQYRRKGRKATPVVPYRVDSQYAGTEDDNWLTRTLEPLQAVIGDYVYSKIEKAFS